MAPDPTPAPPLPVPQPPTSAEMFAIEPASITAMANSWQTESATVKGFAFQAMSEATGASRTAAAIRSCADPAKRATDSIGTRIETFASVLRGFNSTVLSTDASASDGFKAIPTR